MKFSKDITALVLRVQELVLQSDNLTMNYQANISNLSIYSFGENRKYSYHKNIYLDGLIFNEKRVVQELKTIINELEKVNNENSRKNVCV